MVRPHFQHLWKERFLHGGAIPCRIVCQRSGQVLRRALPYQPGERSGSRVVVIATLTLTRHHLHTLKVSSIEFYISGNAAAYSICISFCLLDAKPVVNEQPMHKPAMDTAAGSSVEETRHTSDQWGFREDGARTNTTVTETTTETKRGCGPTGSGGHCETAQAIVTLPCQAVSTLVG